MFYELYGLWLVSDKSIPVVIVNMTTTDLEAFDQRNSFDMRQILFNQKDKSELDIMFADHVKVFFN